MAISYKKEDQLESMFASFAKLPDNMDSDPKKRKKTMTKKKVKTNFSKIDFIFYVVLSALSMLLTDVLPWSFIVNLLIIMVLAFCSGSLFHYAKSWLK